MAKILYENKFLMTRKFHKQYCHVTFRARRKRNQLLSLALAIVALAAGLSFYFLLKWNIPGVVCFCLAAYFVFFIFYGYWFSEWINYRSLKREYGGEQVYIIKFEPSEVHVWVNKTSFRFKYTTISGGYETKDLLILILETKGMIEHGQILFKGSFKNAETVEEFKQFINEKSGKHIFEMTEVS